MTISIRHEMLVFWSAFVCGQVICIIFDFFRSLRKNTKPSKAMVAIEDIVFCLVAFKVFFDTMYITNNGQIRWYIPVSIILSAVIYFCTESKYILKIWNIVFKILKLILTPFQKILTLVKRLILLISNAVKMRSHAIFAPVFDKISQIATKKPHKPHENSDLI